MKLYFTSLDIFAPKVTVSINQSGLHVAGESLTLMCSLSDQETDVNNFQFQWSDGQGTILDADRSKVINTSTLASYLYFTPLRQSHEGTYTCSVTIDGVTEVKSTNVSVNGIIFIHGWLYTCMS